MVWRAVSVGEKTPFVQNASLKHL